MCTPPAKEESPNDRPSRRQFSLRALLLWTAVLACCLGICRWLDAEMEFVAVLACWIVVVVIVRAFLGFRAAALLSIAVATVLFGISAYEVSVNVDPGPDSVQLLPIILMFGCVCGLVVPLGVEVVCFVVRRLDALIGKRGGEKEKKGE